MKIVGLMRCKNEARWIESAVASLFPLCSDVLLLDDHSTDDTRELAAKAGALVCPSPFEGLDESRDKDHLLALAHGYGADWCFFLDGDEILEPGSAETIRALTAGPHESYTFRFVYLWDSAHQQRVDGVYANMWRQSMFRLKPGQRFRRTGNGGNFHCGSVPESLLGRAARCPARIFHMGYMLREDRIRKYKWYRKMDPNNATEDFYRHVAQGDLPEIPATARLKHAGPLALRPL